ncbi:MAG: DUF542 domain-containing protein [Deltaproteobacteria bacterium]|nr:DUF542 domain-containing protein [Deltaproteobacteria bacterium]
MTTKNAQGKDRSRNEELMDAEINENKIVNDIIENFPGALMVFRRHGIDSCCGGDLTLEKAALSAGIDAYRLIAELRLEAGEARAASEEIARHF